MSAIMKLTRHLARKQLIQRRISLGISSRRHVTGSVENDEGGGDSKQSNEDGGDKKQRVFVAGAQSVVERSTYVEEATPKRIVETLDRFIIGQGSAKRAVAVSLRNRWRRQQLDDTLRKEVMPMNLMMMGPTGSGKTEIARRLAQQVDSPFVKVEATKYTEVGIVGSSAEECVKELADRAVKMEREKRIAAIKEEIDALIEKHILARIPGSSADIDNYREKLRRGEFENTKIEVASFRIERPPTMGIPIFAGKGGMFQKASLGGSIRPKSPVSESDKQRDRVPISEAREIIREYELQKGIDEEDVRRHGIKRAEESGIIFLDEIDKLCGDGAMAFSRGAKGEGVQKELLGLIEGTSVATDHGTIQTDHILFICAGAFHTSRPADLLPELQGRIPLRVELEALNENDFYRILTETESNLIQQQRALFGAEGVDLEFSEGAIREVAKYAKKLNENLENIGARRLRAVISKVVEDLSFNAPEKRGETVVIDKDFVRTQLKAIVADEDLSKYIL